MKQRKLNLNKMAIAMLTNGSLENIQGGGTLTCLCSVVSCGGCAQCTNIKITTKREEEDATAALFADSCA
ncbi:hypothetical protein [Sphingobacterium sp.]|uniref:hypothetical protein n=1 Tax=Sphingobacterium sp. TaxID=341027 RepID=UPI0031DE8EF8